MKILRHFKCPFQFILWCLCLHQVHGQHILPEIQRTVSIEVKCAENMVTEMLCRHSRWQ